MNRQLLLIAVALLAVASAQQQKNASTLHCRFCDSEVHPDCETKPDEALDVACDVLDYGESQSRSLAGPKQNRNLLEIFKRESSRAYSANNENTEYRCIKITLKDKNEKNFIRTCAPLRRNIDKACDFIGEQIDPSIKVQSCMECATDLCNSGFSMTSSVFLSLASVVFVWFLTKF